jgi:signal peptidase I
VRLSGDGGVQQQSRRASLLRPNRPDAEAQPPRRSFATREILETIGLTLLIFLAVHFSIQPYRVDGPSMQPGLHTDGLLLVNLLTYDFGSPQRGDVIVLHPPSAPNLQYVKRIIGIPGDTIELTQISVAVDGKVLSEPYISPLPDGAEENSNGCLEFPATGTIDITLSKNQYYVMGDNRTNSQDSRCFGSITRDEIIGKAEVVIFPLDSLHWLPNYSSVFAGVGH